MTQKKCIPQSSKVFNFLYYRYSVLFCSPGPHRKWPDHLAGSVRQPDQGLAEALSFLHRPHLCGFAGHWLYHRQGDGQVPPVDQDVRLRYSKLLTLAHADARAEPRYTISQTDITPQWKTPHSSVYKSEIETGTGYTKLPGQAARARSKEQTTRIRSSTPVARGQRPVRAKNI